MWVQNDLHQYLQHSFARSRGRHSQRSLNDLQARGFLAVGVLHPRSAAQDQQGVHHFLQGGNEHSQSRNPRDKEFQRQLWQW
jgi:hypothetical protein